MARLTNEETRNMALVGADEYTDATRQNHGDSLKRAVRLTKKAAKHG